MNDVDLLESAAVPNDVVATEWAARQPAVLERLLAGTPTKAPRTRRRRTRVSVGAGLTSLLLVGGTAYGTGTVPPGVTAFFASFGLKGGSAFVVPDARLDLALSLGNGSRYEVWTGTDLQGNPCQYERSVSRDGEKVTGGGGCAAQPDDDPDRGQLRIVGADAAWYENVNELILVVADVPATAVRAEALLSGGMRIPLTVNDATHYGGFVVPPGHFGETVRVASYDAQDDETLDVMAGGLWHLSPVVAQADPPRSR